MAQLPTRFCVEHGEAEYTPTDVGHTAVGLTFAKLEPTKSMHVSDILQLANEPELHAGPCVPT